MKKSNSIIFSLILLVVIAAIYRIIPNRPMGFAPQYSMAVFGGAVFVKDKKWAFFLPVISMLISDLLYQLLFKMGVSNTPGFYDGQLVNYVIFASITLFGFMLKKWSILNIGAVSVLAANYFFVVSNFAMWASTNYYPHTMAGLQDCYIAAIPFYLNSILASLLFSGILFGGYYLMKQRSEKVAVA